MLNFFKINDPNRLIIIFLVLLFLKGLLAFQGLSITLFELKWLLLGQRSAEGFFMYEEIFDYTGPLSVFSYRIIDQIFGKSQHAHHIISTFWLFLNAIIFNGSLKKNKIFNENNNLPALFFVLCAVAIPDFMVLSPQIMSLPFLLIGLSKVLDRIANETTDILFLSAGTNVGIATLFYPPAITYFFIFLISFFLFSSSKLRRIGLYFNGFLIPLVLISCFFYWNDNGSNAWRALVNRGLFGQEINYLNEIKNYYSFRIPIFTGLVAMVITLFSSYFTSFQNKTAQMMLLMVVGASIVIWLDIETSPVQMLYFVPSLTFFLVHLMLMLSKGWIKRLVPLIIVGVLILAPYLSYDQLNMGGMMVKKGTDRFTKMRIMLLSDNLSILHGQELASPFLDAQLSKEKIASLNDSVSAQILLKIIKQAPPSVIIDDWMLIPKIFSALPELSKEYQKQKHGYYVRISN